MKRLILLVSLFVFALAGYAMADTTNITVDVQGVFTFDPPNATWADYDFVVDNAALVAGFDDDTQTMYWDSNVAIDIRAYYADGSSWVTAWQIKYYDGSAWSNLSETAATPSTIVDGGSAGENQSAAVELQLHGISYSDSSTTTYGNGTLTFSIHAG